MAEIRSGFRHLLAKPRLYNFFQHLVGAYTWRKKFINNLVNPVIREGDRVIDIGCGTGEILQYLPHNISYFGFDRNPVYIEAARKRFSDRDATFECESVTMNSGARYPKKFNIALAIGLTHHLDDPEATALLQTAKNVLTEDGILFLLDPVFIPEQSNFARFVISKDRGQNVRTLQGYLQLCTQVFSYVAHSIEMRPLRIPYTGVVISCSSKTYLKIKGDNLN